MLRELRSRRTFLIVNGISCLLWLVFIWSNDLFYGRGEAVPPPPVAQSERLSLQVPSVVTEWPQQAIVEGDTDIEEQVEDRLNMLREQQGLPPLKTNTELRDLARQMAALEAGEGSLDEARAQELAFLAFPRQEIGLGFDKAHIQGANSVPTDMADLWRARKTSNGLDRLDFQLFAVGAVQTFQGYVGVLLLGEVLYLYDRDFPRGGSVQLVAQRHESQIDRVIRIERLHVHRGWLRSPVVDEHSVVFLRSHQVDALDVSVPRSHWSLIRFWVNGRLLHGGRPVAGDPETRPQPSAERSH